MRTVILLHIPIHPLTATQAVERLQLLLQANDQSHVMTPNSEMLVEAHRNPAFANILQNTALNIPDSAGLLHMAKWTGQHLPERVTGVDTVMSLCLSLDASQSVYLLGGGEGVARDASNVLVDRNPNLNIAGCFAGSPRDEDAEEIIAKINEAKPHLLLVAYGAPAQDMWIVKHLARMPSVRVAMGIGGTFDFIAGKRKRAPKVLRKVGLEWLWRLVLEPRRIGRIWNAVVVFPWLVIRSKR